MRLWSYAGPTQQAIDFRAEYDITGPVLVDTDQSLRQAYFVPNGEAVFAANPRHYIIDSEGVLVWATTNLVPDEELEVLEELLR